MKQPLLLALLAATEALGKQCPEFIPPSGLDAPFALEQSTWSWRASIDVQGAEDQANDGEEYYAFRHICWPDGDWFPGSDTYELLLKENAVDAHGGEEGDLVMYIESDLWAHGWKLRVYDCNGELIAFLNENPDARYCWGLRCRDLSMQMELANGTVFGYTERSAGWFEDQIKVFTTDLTVGQSEPVATSIKPSSEMLDLGKPEWTITIGNASVPAGDPRFITALTAYKSTSRCCNPLGLWLTRSCCSLEGRCCQG